MDLSVMTHSAKPSWCPIYSNTPEEHVCDYDSQNGGQCYHDHAEAEIRSCKQQKIGSIYIKLTVIHGNIIFKKHNILTIFSWKNFSYISYICICKS